MPTNPLKSSFISNPKGKANCFPFLFRGTNHDRFVPLFYFFRNDKKPLFTNRGIEGGENLYA